MTDITQTLDVTFGALILEIRVLFVSVHTVTTVFVKALEETMPTDDIIIICSSAPRCYSSQYKTTLDQMCPL